MADARGLVPCRETLTHQRVGIESSSLDMSAIRERSGPQVDTGPVGQYHHCGLFESPGGGPLETVRSRGEAPLPVADSEADSCLGGAPPGSGQHPGRLLESSSGGLSGVEPVQSGGITAVCDLGHSPGGPLCIEGQPQTATVLLPTARCSRGRTGCTQSVLEQQVALRLSASTTTVESAKQGSGRSGVAHFGGASLATATVVQSPPTSPLRGTPSSPSEVRSSVSNPGGEGHTVSLEPADHALSGVEADRRRLRSQGLSEAAVDIATAALRSSSRRLYDARWAGWVGWCGQRGHDPVVAPVSACLDFLTEKSTTVALSTLKGYITAMSKRHDPVEGATLSLHPTVVLWRKGIERRKGLPRTLVPPWSLELVLAALKKPPYEPMRLADNKHLSWKVAFLLAITSARRASEIHALRVDPPYLAFSNTTVTLFTDIGFMPKVTSRFHAATPIELPALHDEVDGSLRLLCVRRALKYYVERARAYRQPGETQLLVCYGSDKKGRGVSTQRISKWLVECIGSAYEAIGEAPPEGVKGHQTRGQATSWAGLAGSDPQSICNAATWASVNTFAKHYRLNILERQRSDFGRRVLSVAGSSEASADALAGYPVPPKKRK